ncbi:hypothetical protein ABH19_01380 [Leptospirillum sp. Group II 'CF-1']|jgi:hypothetical protein|nr:hypothetical protein ABH19_01380 [Leptospirillum sp. Group II 'CF-1']
MAPKRQESMTTFQEILIGLATICVVVLVALAIRVIRFLDHLDGTLSRLEKETLPAVSRLSALLGRIDALTGDIENAWFATRKKMDDLGLPPLLRLLRWMPGPAGKLPFPFGILVRALGSGLRAFRGVWKSRDKNGTASGRKESSP